MQDNEEEEFEYTGELNTHNNHGTSHCDILMLYSRCTIFTLISSKQHGCSIVHSVVPIGNHCNSPYFFLLQILEDFLPFIAISPFHHVIFFFFRVTVIPLRSVIFSVLPLMKTWILILMKHAVMDPTKNIISIIWLSLLSSQTKRGCQGRNLHWVMFVHVFDFVFSRCLFDSLSPVFVFG